MPTDPLIDEALTFFRYVADSESPLREKMLADLKFAGGEQWDPTIKADRERDGKPSLVIDRLSGPISQVTNSLRSSRPAIQINPVDSGADVDTAEILQGLIRRIENTSNAEVAYNWAGEHQVKMGRGYWRVLTDYVTPSGTLVDGLQPDDFELDLKIARVKNQFSVYLDPDDDSVDGSNATKGLIIDDLSHAQYDARWGGEDAWMDAQSLVEMSNTGNEPANWITEQHIRVAEYFYTVYSDQVYCLLADGTVIEKPAKKADYRKLQIRAERTYRKRAVKWALITAAEVLDRRDWPGQYIPIVPVYGETQVIDGQTDYRGIVRMAIDPQRMINFERSATTQTVAQAPQSPWIVPAAAVSQYKGMWETANTRAWAFLPYDQYDLNGRELAKPERMFGEPPIQAMVALSQQFENDLRAATGFFDVQGQEQRPEQSGKAILARQRQGETGNSHFLDNLGRAVRQTGRILIDLIPHVYDTQRILRVLGKDDQQKTVQIMPGIAQQAQQAGHQVADLAQGMDGIDAIFDPTVGRYDVTVSVGKSFESGRQEAVDMMTAALQADPQLFGVIGDLYFGMMDTPVAHVIAERLKPKDEPNQIPPAVQQHMQQLQQDADKNRADLMKVQLQEQSRIQQTQMELASKEKIALIQATATFQATQVKVDAENARTIEAALESKLSHELNLHVDATNRLHDRMTQIADQMHQVGMAHLEHQQALQQGAQQGQIASDQMTQQATLQPQPDGASA